MSDFKIGHREQSTINVLELKGYLDAHTAPKLEEAFQNLLKSQRFKIVVNCRELSYISSAGLGVFMAFIEDVRNNKGDIKLTNMTPRCITCSICSDSLSCTRFSRMNRKPSPGSLRNRTSA